MTGIIERKLLHGISYDEKDELILPKLYINILAVDDNVEVPVSLKVAFDENNPMTKAIANFRFQDFFTNCSALFFNPEEANIILSEVNGKGTEVGINLIAINQSLKITMDERTDYSRYKDTLCEYGIIDTAFSLPLFEKLKSAMLYLPIMSTNREIYGVINGNSNEKAIAAAKAIKDTLKIPKKEQVSFLYYVLEVSKKIHLSGKRRSYNTEEREKISEEALLYINIPFNSRKKIKEYRKDVVNCVTDILDARSPLAVLQGLEIYKKTNNYTGWQNEEGNHVVYKCTGSDFAKNSILLELGILFDEIERVIAFRYIEKRLLSVINPSFSFISKWIIKRNDEPISFIVIDDKARSILKDSLSNLENISFISMSEYKETPIPDCGEIIVCPKAEELTAENITEVSNRKNKNKDSIILALDIDSSFEKADSLAKIELNSISQLITFPTGLGDESAGKRNLWVSENKTYCNLSISSLAKKSTRENDLRRLPTRVFKKNDLFSTDAKTLRKRIIELDKVAVTEKRIHNQPLQFTPNLMIKYSGFSDSLLIDNEFYTAVCTFLIRTQVKKKLKEKKKKRLTRKKESPYEEEKQSKDKYVTIKETRIDHDCYSIDEATKYLKEEYFLGTKELSSSSKKVSVGYILRLKIKDLRQQGNIVPYPDTLKDFVCLFSTEISEAAGEKNWGAFLQVVLKSDVSLSKITELTPEVFCEALDEVYGDDEDFQLRALTTINVAFEIAVTNHLLSRNLFDENEAAGREWKNKFLRVRRLTKKTFTCSEMQQVYDILISSLHNNNKSTSNGKSCKVDQKAISFSILISLITGLESNIVNAIRWNQLKLTELGFYVLYVDRQLTNDGKSVKDLRDNEYRYIPLGRILTEILETQKKKIEKNAMNMGKKQDFIDTCYVAKAFSETLDEMQVPLPPCKVAPEVKRLLSEKLGIKEELVFVPDYGGGTKEVNLAYYGGDFLRENFKYYAKYIAIFYDDERNYYVGNTRSTTAGVHYIEYSCDDFLIRLNTKLNRISSFLEADNKKIKDSSGKGCFIRSDKGTALDISFDKPATGNITFAVGHGFKSNLESNNAD